MKEMHSKYAELKASSKSVDPSKIYQMEGQMQELANKLFIERQGAKERVAELLDNIKKLEKQQDVLSRKNKQLNDWVSDHKKQVR